MAMAPRSLASLLLLSILISAASAARTVGDSVQEACSKSQFPKECTDGLSSKPESQKATPRKLAELFVMIAADKGSSLATFLEGKFNNGAQDAPSLNCYDSCGDDVEEAMAHLNGLIREPTDAKFLELKSWLASTLGGAGTCDEACKDVADKEEVVTNSFEFEKLLRVTLDLITEASGSMSADIALPPSSDAAAPAAYGAAMPPERSFSKAVEAPEGSETEGPSAAPVVASGPAAAADAPAAAASGGADAPSSGAPAPSSGSAASPADAPSGGDSSGASAPSSDDTASDDDDNDTSA